MKKSWFAFTCVLALLVGMSCSDGPVDVVGPVRLGVVQVGDSLQVTVAWGAAEIPGPTQAAQSGYDVLLTEVGADTLGYHSIGMQLADTFYLSLDLPVGPLDTLSIQAGVATRDVADNLSIWSLSNIFHIVGPLDPPNPPGPVTVDTVDNVLGFIMKPDSVVDLEVRDSTQICLFALMKDGRVVMTNASMGIPYCDALLIEAQGDASEVMASGGQLKTLLAFAKGPTIRVVER